MRYRLLLLVLAFLFLLDPLPAALEARRSVPEDPVMLGFTLSPTQAGYLGMPWDRTMKAALDLRPEVVRIGAYWRQIERRPGTYDFRSLDALLEGAAAEGRKIVLTVGMKAPRWPEYYIPRWLERGRDLPDRSIVSDDPEVRRHTLAFIAQVVERYRDSDAVAFWQIENEPLDSSGPHGWRIAPKFLEEEIALVRALDHRDRPIISTMLVPTHPLAMLPPLRRPVEDRARRIMNHADILGIDVYPSLGIRAFGRDLYFNFIQFPWESLAVRLKEQAGARDKPVWVMEAQAEPWEPGLLTYTDAPQSRSVNAETAAAVYQRLRDARFENILFWGVEHWFMRLDRHQDSSWWDIFSPFFQT
jgi:hypothetical protein